MSRKHHIAGADIIGPYDCVKTIQPQECLVCKHSLRHKVFVCALLLRSQLLWGLLCWLARQVCLLKLRPNLMLQGTHGVWGDEDSPHFCQSASLLSTTASAGDAAKLCTHAIQDPAYSCGHKDIPIARRRSFPGSPSVHWWSPVMSSLLLPYYTPDMISAKKADMLAISLFTCSFLVFSSDSVLHTLPYARAEWELYTDNSQEAHVSHSWMPYQAKKAYQFDFVAGGVLQGLPLIESPIFEECGMFIRELLIDFSKAQAWGLEFSLDFLQAETRECFTSLWDPVRQGDVPLDRRILLLSILLEYVKAWKSAMQNPPKYPDFKAQVLPQIWNVQKMFSMLALSILFLAWFGN